MKVAVEYHDLDTESVMYIIDEKAHSDIGVVECVFQGRPNHDECIYFIYVRMNGESRMYVGEIVKTDVWNWRSRGSSINYPSQRAVCAALVGAYLK